MLQLKINERHFLQRTECREQLGSITLRLFCHYFKKEAVSRGTIVMQSGTKSEFTQNAIITKPQCLLFSYLLIN